jgi:hypothetical protein
MLSHSPCSLWDFLIQHSVVVLPVRTIVLAKVIPIPHQNSMGTRYGSTGTLQIRFLEKYPGIKIFGQLIRNKNI